MTHPVPSLDEDLIRWGWEEDVWFHVDKLSSAHVYLRLPTGMSWDAIPEDLLTDLAQLVKANSIEGHKLNNLQIVYTPWSNLKKTGDMATGQVGFHSPRLVKYIRVETRINEIVNRLNKTKTESFPDLCAERQEHQQELNNAKKAVLREAAKREKEIEAERKRQAEARSYDRIYTAAKMTSNKDAGDDDDFM